MEHDFLSGYSAKILEYVLAVTYLVLFVGFWRYVQGGKKKAPQPEAGSGHETRTP